MYLKYYFIALYFLINSVFTQSNHTILTYNLLNYEDEDDREGYYQLIIDEIQPDIIVCQEVNANDGFNHFLNDVLNIIQPNEWLGAGNDKAVRKTVKTYLESTFQEGAIFG